jgi:aminopeptidase N
VSWRRAGTAIGGLAVALSLAAAPATAQTPGAAGLGDPYFPLAGNGGYDVENYDIQLAFSPSRGRIQATATITATATQSLSSFNLDLSGLRVISASVNGLGAGFRREGTELTIAPAGPIAAGSDFQVVISYAGRPRPLKRVGIGFPTGWQPTRDGAFVASEPRGSITWFPCNDHPTDKASYTFTVTVPRGRTVVANGSLLSVTRSGRSTTFVWRETEPMATYLATVTSGRFRLNGGTVGGIPSWTAIAKVIGGRRARRMLAVMPAAIARFSSHFGPYPFSSTGAIVESGFGGYALETQTRPIYGGITPPIVVVHELAHQWFGDAVSVERWSDIWLNEGFATWAELLWQTNGDDRRLRRILRTVLKAPRQFFAPLWKVPPGDPGVKKMFSLSVYNRGALTLEALRELIGDPAFYLLLRRWVSENLYGNVSTSDFIALAEEVSGRQLDTFFSIWLFQKGKPRNWQ